MCELLEEMEPFSAEVVEALEAFKRDLIRKQKIRKCAKFCMLIVVSSIVYYLFITN